MSVKSEQQKYDEERGRKSLKGFDAFFSSAGSPTSCTAILEHALLWPMFDDKMKRRKSRECGMCSVEEGKWKSEERRRGKEEEREGEGEGEGERRVGGGVGYW